MTERILSAVPVAGRIAGFNRQQPGSGIPLHSDGNNMWLTAQIPITTPSPEGDHAFIHNGGETRVYETGKAVVYDTTYSHYTKNTNAEEERIVLHIDFWNILEMTDAEIDVMMYIYELREKFLKAEKSSGS